MAHSRGAYWISCLKIAVGIEGISGTSAGAMNAVVVADGVPYVSNGRRLKGGIPMNDRWMIRGTQYSTAITRTHATRATRST